MNITLDEALKLRAGITPKRLAAWMKSEPKAKSARAWRPPGSSKDVQADILRVLQRGRTRSAAELSKATGADRASVGYALREMMGAGLVRRLGEKRFAKYIWVGG